MMHVLALQMPGLGEWIVIAAIGLLLFGKRLPEVGRSLGKGIVEFKKGIKGLEDEVDSGPAALRNDQAPEQIRAPQRIAATAPKFEETPAATPNTNITTPPRA